MAGGAGSVDDIVFVAHVAAVGGAVALTHSLGHTA